MNKNKKILIATPLYPPQVGGPATRTALLEKKFPELGFPISIAKFGDVLRFPKIVRHIFYFFLVLFKGIRADIILAQDPVSVGLPSLFAAKILRKKFVLIIVGDYAWEQGSQRSGVTDLLDAFSTEYDKYPLLVRILKKTQFFVAYHADKIIVPSFYLKKIIINWGIGKDKINVVYNSFDAPSLPGEKESIRKKLGLTGHMLVSAGRLVPWKGFAKLITFVMPKLISKYPDTRLYIVGEGPDKSYLETLINQNKMDKNIVLIGRKPQGELFEYIRAADAFVLNTSYEGMSHQLLEVMALETPIVTTDAGGNKEIIVDGVNGMLTRYDEGDKITDAILRVFEDKNWTQQLVLNGKQKIKDFSEERMLSELAKELG
ncbi:MAG: glycosyltransferase family 4 protein [Patescibacteria group bacterium]|nr:glycosyltransferase family 4 protein [bacterium]MDZ4240506.1 glycosyltransferase family 4 protein [Patescibacteria group bacterium]